MGFSIARHVPPPNLSGVVTLHEDYCEPDPSSLTWKMLFLVVECLRGKPPDLIGGTLCEISNHFFTKPFSVQSHLMLFLQCASRAHFYEKLAAFWESTVAAERAQPRNERDSVFISLLNNSHFSEGFSSLCDQTLLNWIICKLKSNMFYFVHLLFLYQDSQSC